MVCALLHDTIEDTSATIQDIEENFGKEVAKLVDGVTKLTLLEESLIVQSKQKILESYCLQVPVI